MNSEEIGRGNRSWNLWLRESHYTLEARPPEPQSGEGGAT